MFRFLKTSKPVAIISDNGVIRKELHLHANRYYLVTVVFGKQRKHRKLA